MHSVDWRAQPGYEERAVVALPAAVESSEPRFHPAGTSYERLEPAGAEFAACAGISSALGS